MPCGIGEVIAEYRRARPSSTQQCRISGLCRSVTSGGSVATVYCSGRCYCTGVPELSRFFGIVIRMFVEAGAQHHRAHFHAYYQDHAAVFSVDTIECLGGSLPKTQQRLVEAWAEIHGAELQHDWALLQSGQPPVKIDPLR